MELTINFIEENFNKFNALYFNNELEKPSFKIINTKTVLGRMCYITREYTKKIFFRLEISRYYKRDEYEYLNTILHEMIHQYIKQKRMLDTSVHGRLFHNIAERINRCGWNITAKGRALEVAESGKIYNVFLLKRDYGAFAFAVSKKYASLHKIGLESHKDNFVYLETTNPMFGSFPTCRTRMIGRKLTQEEYEKALSYK